MAVIVGRDLQRSGVRGDDDFGMFDNSFNERQCRDTDIIERFNCEFFLHLHNSHKPPLEMCLLQYSRRAGTQDR